MAVRNGERFVRDAIDSVLSQSVKDFEFLIVDDGSTDGTRTILSAYPHKDSRIRVLANERTLGPYPAANLALSQARGDVIARHDADDVSPPDRFATQLDALNSASDAVLVTGVIEAFGRSDTGSRVFAPPAWQPRLEWELLFRNAVGAGGHVMFPRVLRGEPIRFPAKYALAEDYGLWCALSRRGRILSPSRVVYRYRQHDSSITSCRKAEQDACFFRMCHEYQSRYLPSSETHETTSELARELARFWNICGSAPFSRDIRKVVSVLHQLKAAFLNYVEGRYGSVDKKNLESELDAAITDRLGYWLHRSLRPFDRRRCCECLAAARAQGMALQVAGKAGRLTAGVVTSKFRRRSLPSS